MKFFVTTVNSWESLIVEIKISILVDLGVLDSRLYEVKISKLNKQHISESGNIKIYIEIYLKMTHWWVIFKTTIFPLASAEPQISVTL